MEIDLNQVASTFFAGGAIWAAIRVEIRMLWRETDRLIKRVDKLES